MSLFKSFRVMAGTIKQYVILFATAVGVTAALGIVRMLAPKEIVVGFIDGFVPFFATISVTVSCMIGSMGVFNANNPLAVGYKYYHSLPNAYELFRKALIFSDIFAIALLVLYSAVVVALFGWMQVFFALGAGAFCIGLLNFFGHGRSPFAKMMPFVVAGGFAGGFATGISEENGFELTPLFIKIILPVAAVIFVSGIAFAVLRAKKAWEREG